MSCWGSHLLSLPVPHLTVGPGGDSSYLAHLSQISHKRSISARALKNKLITLWANSRRWRPAGIDQEGWEYVCERDREKKRSCYAHLHTILLRVWKLFWSCCVWRAQAVGSSKGNKLFPCEVLSVLLSSLACGTGLSSVLLIKTVTFRSLVWLQVLLAGDSWIAPLVSLVMEKNRMLVRCFQCCMRIHREGQTLSLCVFVCVSVCEGGCYHKSHIKVNSLLCKHLTYLIFFLSFPLLQRSRPKRHAIGYGRQAFLSTPSSTKVRRPSFPGVHSCGQSSQSESWQLDGFGHYGELTSCLALFAGLDFVIFLRNFVGFLFFFLSFLPLVLLKWAG